MVQNIQNNVVEVAAPLCLASSTKSSSNSRSSSFSTSASRTVGMTVDRKLFSLAAAASSGDTAAGSGPVPVEAEVVGLEPFLADDGFEPAADGGLEGLPAAAGWPAGTAGPASASVPLVLIWQEIATLRGRGQLVWAELAEVTITAWAALSSCFRWSGGGSSSSTSLAFHSPKHTFSPSSFTASLTRSASLIGVPKYRRRREISSLIGGRVGLHWPASTSGSLPRLTHSSGRSFGGGSSSSSSLSSSSSSRPIRSSALPAAAFFFFFGRFSHATHARYLKTCIKPKSRESGITWDCEHLSAHDNHGH